MHSRSNAGIVVFLVMAFAGSSLAPSIGFMVVGDHGESRVGPFYEPSPWTDSFDDMSRVYVPEGGLVNVEVTGGEVRLLPGQSEGWVASSIITCPVGQRYDFVLLEVYVPGSSMVEISILNASKESGVIGFANETIPPHVKVNGTEHSVYDLSPWSYPEIRIQVNLVASGTDRPRLMEWSLYYVPLDEWRDDFLGKGKISAWQDLNLIAGTLALNLTGRRGATPPVYEAYPTIAMPDQYRIDLLCHNDAHSGYKEITSMSSTKGTIVRFGELNGDGFIDLVALDPWTLAPTRIYWGSSSGNYSAANMHELTTPWSYDATTGDFNGDGWNDLAFVCNNQSGNHFGLIFFNNGHGTFDSTADITLSYPRSQVLAGDVNGDGCDDLLYDRALSFCGPDGPGPTPNVTFDDWPCLMQDVNQDGYCDVLTRPNPWDEIDVLYGCCTGIDMIVDCTITGIPHRMYDVRAGDVNGDGYVDIAVFVIGDTDPWPHYFLVYEGDEEGWTGSRVHKASTGINRDSQDAVFRMADINRDGYDDLLSLAYIGNPFYALTMFLGKPAWPSGAPDWSKTVDAGRFEIAVPRGGPRVMRFTGALTTMAIDLPADMTWDVLHVDGTFPPNTSMRLSVTDSSDREIAGYRRLTDTNVDLSRILERSIKFKVVLLSDSNLTSPALDRLTAKWMERGCWRDQFYGAIKADRILNLSVAGDELARSTAMGMGPQLLFMSLRGTTGYDTNPLMYLDGGGLDYLSGRPIPFETRGIAGADVADVNGDGFLDVAFAVRQTSETAFDGESPLFLGTSVGWRDTPDHTFPTVGASDVLVRDLNGDGHLDVVFAQESDGTSYRVNSTLFWGKAGVGWNSTPDVQFETNGASGVTAADLDSDGCLDLSFACFREATSTATDSMVFLQDANGFCGTTPSFKLPTRGASAVDAGDVNGDGLMDLAFANSVSGGQAEIESYIYLGKAGGGFEAAPKALRTSGAEDVALADVDGDGDLDAVFANMRDNVGRYDVDSYLYLNDGSGGFPATPSVRFPATGAVALAVADLDGTGRKDLVFACQYNGTSYNVSSVVYLGTASGWSPSPDLILPTVGASDVLVGRLLKAGEGGYMSKAIIPEDPANTGAFHTFRYTATLGAGQSGKVQLVDASTWDVLAETPLQSGTNEWLVKDAFKFKEHQSVRVVATASGLDGPGEFSLDDLWLNWTPRVKQPPQVLGLSISSPSVYRLKTASLSLNASDEYDPTRDLSVWLEHRLNGSMGQWATYLLTPPTLVSGMWTYTLKPRTDAPVGVYDFRVDVTDKDGMRSGFVVFPGILEVLNNRPTAPEIRLDPAHPVTTSTLQVFIVQDATDLETGALTYRYSWYCDWILQEDLTSDTVLSTRTTKGQNWSVEVRAFDGLDAGPAVNASRVIENAPPMIKKPLPNPMLDEDVVDDLWLNLSGAFEDPDGDPLSWTVDPIPQHIQVAIDPTTGKVTLHPAKDWNGQESVTFIASDGELTASRSVLVTVIPINDIPWFTTVNGEPITTDPVHLDIDQGKLLVIDVGTEDVEGDVLVFSVNSTLISVDGATGELRFLPGPNDVGTFRFALTMFDTASPDVRVRLNFTITVKNVNDPMDAPHITSPKAGATYKAGVTFSLSGTCTDPDTIFGQVLNFTWWWNGTNLIGHGPALTWNFSGPGTYLITLNVTDGEFSKEDTLEIIIEPKESQGGGGGGGGTGGGGGISMIAVIGIIVAIAVIGAVILLVASRRREEPKRPEAPEDEKRAALRQMADEVKATADEMEREVAAAKAARPAEVTKVIIETRGLDGQVVRSSIGVPEQTLAVQPKETEVASAEVQRLFKEMGAEEPQVPTEEAEALHLESLKRKYLNAIGRLPYGIPTPELKDRDWNELASALATGQKKEAPDGRELILIDGRWYFSDVKDASSFLTEHGMRPRAEPKKAVAVPMTDKATLLAKLEERFILGEISGAQYEELKKKLKE